MLNLMSNTLVPLAWPVLTPPRPQTPREIGRERRVKALGTVLDQDFVPLIETVCNYEKQARRLFLAWTS